LNYVTWTAKEKQFQYETYMRNGMASLWNGQIHVLTASPDSEKLQISCDIIMSLAVELCRRKSGCCALRKCSGSKYDCSIGSSADLLSLCRIPVERYTAFPIMMCFFLVREMIRFRSLTGNEKVNNLYACLKYMLNVHNVIPGTCFQVLFLVASYSGIFGLGFLIILFMSLQLIRWTGSRGSE
jgi:hypothetical protein